MPTDGEPTPPATLTGRGLTAALGTNLWLLGLVVPTVGTRAAEIAPLCLPAPVLLAFGVATRSAPALLLGVPLASLAPLGLPELTAARQGGVPFLLAALSLIAYLASALHWLARVDERAREPSGVVVIKPFAGPPPEPRWWRRRRVYLGLTSAAALVPAFFLYMVNIHPPVRAAVDESFRQPESARALMTAGGALASALIFAACLVRPLMLHLDGEPPTGGASEGEAKRWSWRLGGARANRTERTFLVVLLVVVVVLATALIWAFAAAPGVD